MAKTRRNCLSCGRLMWADPEDCRGERKGWCNGRHNCQRCINRHHAIDREAMRRGGYSEEVILRICGPVTPEEAEVTQEEIDA
jgi:hypothetical protein